MAGSVESQATPAENPHALIGLPSADTLPILAVDDRPENLLALEAVLGPLGLTVVTATSGEEALRLVLERDFALILLDVRMPGLGGIETARLIKTRERTRDLPIVFLTAARDEVTDIVRGYGVGAVDYVLKPLDPELLRSKVAVFAELEHSRRALRHSEAFLRSAFEAAPIGKTVLDSERRIVRANPAFARVVGRDQSSLTRVAIDALCHPEDCGALASVFDRVASEPGGADELGVDIRLMTVADREIWVAPTASLIASAEQSSPLLLVQWVDVTSRRRAEQARAELLIEQAARAQAEASAERLEQLQQITEPIESRSVDDLLAELAHRLVRLFDAAAAEVEVDNDGRRRALAQPGVDIAEPVDGGSWHEAPLAAAGEAIGALRVALPHGRSFPASDLALLRDAADRVSLVIRRAQLHEQEHRIAVELQRGLLPTRLPELPGVEIAAHSEAAGLGTEVGGDWYDVFPLPGDRLGVVIGDVTGSGIRAASMMGQLRSVTRAFALSDPDPPSPAEVLTRVHGYHTKLGFDQLFTVLYLILDPATGTVAWANAGHPPPVLRSGGGGVRMLLGSESMMCFTDVTYQDRTATMRAGDALILYTDGLVERRGEAIDAGLERLTAAVSAGPERPEALCAHLLRSAADGATRPDDDVTALVMRLVERVVEGVNQDGGAPRHFEVVLAPDLGAATMARRLLEQSFGALLDPAELERAKLAVSELATNAVRHGQGEITLRADLDELRLLVEVIDEGPGFAFAARAEDSADLGGWGLSLVDGSTSRWGIQDERPHVWFEIHRAGKPSD